MYPRLSATAARIAHRVSDLVALVWTRNRKLDNGGGQYSCSQCAGRVTTNAKTRNASVVPADTAPFLRIEAEQCCHSKVSIPADLLDASQDIPFGTPAHDKSYGRRNPSEKTISMIKDKGGLKAGWCRSFGLAAHTIGALALAIAHNPDCPVLHTDHIAKATKESERKPLGM